MWDITFVADLLSIYVSYIASYLEEVRLSPMTGKSFLPFETNEDFYKRKVEELLPALKTVDINDSEENIWSDNIAVGLALGILADFSPLAIDVLKKLRSSDTLSRRTGALLGLLYADEVITKAVVTDGDLDGFSEMLRYRGFRQIPYVTYIRLLEKLEPSFRSSDGLRSQLQEYWENWGNRQPLKARYDMRYYETFLFLMKTSNSISDAIREKLVERIFEARDPDTYAFIPESIRLLTKWAAIAEICDAVMADILDQIDFYTKSHDTSQTYKSPHLKVYFAVLELINPQSLEARYYKQLMELYKFALNQVDGFLIINMMFKVMYRLGYSERYGDETRPLLLASFDIKDTKMLGTVLRACKGIQKPHIEVINKVQGIYADKQTNFGIRDDAEKLIKAWEE